MKPHYKLAETQTPDGARLSLNEHDGSYCIRVNGQQLMHSSVATSELLLGELGCERHADRSYGKFLIGGLGLGFTLKAALKKAGATAIIQVAELMPEIVAWNREHLLKLNGSLLDDPRVEILIEDVRTIIASAEPNSYDSMMLDIDNGTTAVVSQSNEKLYSNAGIRKMAAALKTDGRLVIWSACADPVIAHRLGKAGFRVQAVPAKIHDSAKRSAYMLYVADKTTALRLE